MLLLLFLGLAMAAPRALTVLLCPEADGCPEAREALMADAARRGIAWEDFSTFIATADARPRQRFVEALERLEAEPSRAHAEAARAALKALAAPVDPDALFRLHVLEGAALLSAGDAAGAEAAFARAASVSNGRVHDLPPLDQRGLAMLLSLSEKVREEPPATLEIFAPPPVLVWVDGRPAGEIRSPGPLSLSLAPGWHRVAIERPGVPGARVAEVVALSGRSTPLQLEAPQLEGALVREAALLAVMGGQPADPEHQRVLVAQAREGGWEAVRFVSLVELPGAVELPPEELVIGPRGERWGLRSLWLDVAKGRLVGASPPARVRPKREGERLRLGAGLGYTRLSARDHLGLELVLGLPVGPWPALGAELRLGVLRANEDYYLYEDWVDPHLFPVSLGLRAGPPQGGPYGRLAAQAVIPYALGGEAALGWELPVTATLRLQAEATGGLSDQGGAVGGRLFIIGRR